MDEKQCTVAGRRCHLFGGEDADSCILCAMGSGEAQEISDTAALLYASEDAARCRLVVFETADWNAELSPWPAEAAFGDEPFAGNAPATLCWITDALLPRLREEGQLSPGAKLYLAGYSLAGLFALWAFWETDRFDGAASCSGSLWLPGWMDYMQSRSRSRDGIVYLSLGSREEKTKNARMAAVGDNTRACYSLLRRSAHITKAALEWNRGGHFARPTERLVRGMRWLLQTGGAAAMRADSKT